MKIKKPIILAAATMATLPLHALQPTPVAAEIQAPSSGYATHSKLAQRIKALEALTFVPADVEASAIVTHLSTNLPGDLAKDCIFDSIAIGIAKGNGATLTNLSTLVVRGVAGNVQEDTFHEWMELAKSEIQPTLLRAANSKDHERIFRQTLAKTKLHPVYIACTANPYNRSDFQEFISKLVSEIRRENYNNPNVRISAEGKDFMVVTISGAAFIHGSAYSWQERMLMEELQKRTFTVYLSFTSTQAKCAIYEDSSELNIPINAENSVLNTPAWSAVDANLNDDIILAGSFSPQLLNGIYNGLREVLPVLDPVNTVFSTLSKGSRNRTAENTAYREAVSALRSIRAELSALIPTDHNPSFIKVWKTYKGYHAEISTDAHGYSYQPAKQLFADRVQDPRTIFYFESSPLTKTGNNGFNIKGLSNNGLAVFKGFYHTFKPSVQADIDSSFAEMAPAIKIAEDGISSVESILNGLGGSTAVVVDTRAIAPRQWSKSRRSLPLPRIAFYSGVQDRTSIATGWDGLVNTAQTIADYTGEEDINFNMLPIVPSTIGNVTSYTLQMPELTEDACLNSCLTDTAIVVGTSRKLNLELIQAAGGNRQLNGATFNLRTAPLAGMLKVWANATGNYNLRYFSEIAEDLSEEVESINGSTSIQNGVRTLRLDINLNK